MTSVYWICNAFQGLLANVVGELQQVSAPPRTEKRKG